MRFVPVAFANPEINYENERLTLRSIYVKSSPRSRLGVIRKRLAQDEIGPTRLVTVVSGVEALARSLAVHKKAESDSDIESAYALVRLRKADALVEDVFEAFGQKTPVEYFSEDTWSLFREAISFRNLIVHECTYLGQDKYPTLIQATVDVLQALIAVAKLE